jgi:hypothetical protein
VSQSGGQFVGKSESLIRGWVYVISNPSLPGLVKVGFSRKDPQLRAQEFGGAGIPHPYKVEYDCIVKAPRDIEQRVHKRLEAAREQKEWFRCTVAEAARAIRDEAKGEIIAESTFAMEQSEPTTPPRDPLDALLSVGRFKPQGRRLWTLDRRSRVLTENRTGRRIESRDYTYDAGGQVKGFILRDGEHPWVDLADVEVID